MLKKRLYTLFIVASHGNGKVRRLSLPHSVLVTIGIFALVGVIVVCAGAFEYGKLLFRVVDYERRLSENDILRSENLAFKVQSAQLGEKIDFLETLSHKLMLFSGMRSDKSVGGIGGTLSQPRPASSNLTKTLDSYSMKLSSLEESYRNLDNQISENVLWEAAQPSIMPVRGYVTAGYGDRPDPFDSTVREPHRAIDISAPMGRMVIAPADGTIIYAGQRAGFGNIIIIDHKFGLTTRYAHLQRMVVQVGQHIARGEIIGYVGMSGRTTGPHLHFELWRSGRPVNPLKYIQDASVAHGRP